MKVKLLVPKVIQGTVYPANCVIGLSEPEVEAIIAAGEGCAVPDGTMARKAAYGVVGCMPPEGFMGVSAPPSGGESDSMLSFFAGAVMGDAKKDHGADTKQKTNTLKK